MRVRYNDVYHLVPSSWKDKVIYAHTLGHYTKLVCEKQSIVVPKSLFEQEMEMAQLVV